jgi:hypothetical protein
VRRPPFGLSDVFLRNTVVTHGVSVRHPGTHIAILDVRPQLLYYCAH